MSNIKIKPLHDNVIVRRIEEKTETAGGIVLPGAVEDRPTEGVVLAVGPGKTLPSGYLDTLDVIVGDTVIFGQKSGSDITIDGEELLVLTEEEIIAILR